VFAGLVAPRETMAFSDDAFNKVNETLQASNGAGTLIGNWAEERALRDASGEGRNIPQRHLPRSGMLTNWDQVPSGGPRKQDNTFERIYGPKAAVKHVPQSKAIGGFEDDVFGDVALAATLQADGRIPRMGERELAMSAAYHEAAENFISEEEAIADEVNKARFFNTTTGDHYGKPNEALAEKAEHCRASCKLELLHGPRPDRMMHMDNPGLNQPGHTHYSNLEGITFQRAALADPRCVSSVKSSAFNGANTFGRNSEFSKPVGECMLGLSKDEELEKMYGTLQEANPFRTHGGAAPRGVPFQGVPSLPAVKTTIHSKIAEVWGAPGYVILRQLLFNQSDEEGFIKKSDVVAILREQLGLSTAEVTDKILDVYLNLQIKVKKNELHVGTLMSSLRPALPPAMRKNVVEAFQRMQPVDGAVLLGSWLEKLTDANLQETLITAFGGQDVDMESVAQTPVTEHVFTDILSDLGPLADLDALLAS
jgi:hypothetical protein